MHNALRILITNNTLAVRAGSELYVRDLAVALVRRGHFPMAYSPILGDVAAELRRATVPVVSKLGDLNTAPDLIHGQHHLEAMSAMLHYRGIPAVFACHGWAPWEESPPVFPAIQRYVAVDDLCRERLYSTPGVRSEQVEVLYNFVDLSRFVPRSELPKRPRTALVFSNYASEGIQLDTIRRACARVGIQQVDVAGACSGRVIAEPGVFLPHYDLVFAKARCALEALASGAAVIVADFSGLGGMVSTENMHRLRALNFGVRTMQAHVLNEENLLRELERYDAEDAVRVSAWIRKDADLEAAVDRWISIYQNVLTNAELMQKGPDQSSDTRAAADYLRFLSVKFKAVQHLESAKNETGAALTQQQNLNKSLQHKLEDVEAALTQQQNLNMNLQHKLESVEAALKAIKDSNSWRLLGFYRRAKAWVRTAI
jgi:hypothetical protein